MNIVILILIIINIFSTSGWLSLLTNLSNRKINFERHIIFKSIVMDFTFILVPNYFPEIIGKWILFALFYLVVGFLITAHEGKKNEKRWKKEEKDRIKKILDF